MPYFDRTYFDSAYFDTDTAASGGRVAAGPVTLIQPDDELAVALLLALEEDF